MRRLIARFKYWLDHGDETTPLYLTGRTSK